MNLPTKRKQNTEKPQFLWSTWHFGALVLCCVCLKVFARETRVFGVGSYRQQIQQTLRMIFILNGNSFNDPFKN